MLDRDRSITVALIALQRDLISQQQLLEALKAWKQSGNVPLERILVEQGAILEAQLQRIQVGEATVSLQAEASIESTLQVGPSQTLTALIEQWSSDATLSLDQQTLDAATLVAKTLDGAQQRTILADGSLHPTASASDLRYGTPDRYRIERSHAKGGLGEVSVATDLELNREVAFKEIQARFADDSVSRDRFIVEAEITGSLEHPGIVPVYGLGLFEDGRPFYAMRFIRGSSMKGAIDAFHEKHQASGSPRHGFASLEFRQLLNRFIGVCHAIDFAHSRGVVHLDIKPANVMLGEFGETLVVDWGLARILSTPQTPASTTTRSVTSRVSVTSSGSIAGTPAFMSPEQAEGRFDELQTASDIYSLGATLYYLLAGKTAFDQKDLPSLLRAVIRGEFIPLRSVSANVPAPLEAICRKAMSLASKDRYPSARNLAEDIERWLADETVSVYQEPMLVKARRWIRRHQTLASTAGVGVLATLLFLAIFSTTLGAKNAELSRVNRSLDLTLSELNETNTELELTNKDLIVANENERLARSQADADRAEAISQGSFVLSTLAAVVIDLQVAIESMPGGGELRIRLLNTAINKLSQISTNYIDHASTDRTTAIALADLGDLALELGASAAQDAEAEDDGQTLSGIQLADRFYARALNISEELVQRDPEDPEFRRLLSVCLFKRGDVAALTGRTDETGVLYRQAFDIRKELLDELPGDTMVQYHFAYACQRLGEYHLDGGKLEEALDLLQQGVQVARDALLDVDAPSLADDVKFHLAHLRLFEGLVLYRLERMDQAEEAFTESLELQRGLQDKFNLDLRVLSSVATSLVTLGDIKMSRGNATEALAYFNRSLELREELTRLEPLSRIHSRDVAISLDRAAGVLLTLGQADEAKEKYEQAITRYGALLEEEPNNTELQQMKAMSNSGLGDLSMNRRDFADAETRYRETVASFDAVLKLDETSIETQHNRMTALFKLGESLRAQKKWPDAQAAYEQGLEQLESMEEMGASYPSIKNERRLLENAIRNIVGLQIVLGDWEVLLEQPADAIGAMLEARAVMMMEAGDWEAAIQAARKIAELDSSTMKHLYNAACVTSRYATHLKDSGQEAESQMVVTEAFGILKRSVEAGMNDMELLSTDSDLAPVRALPEFQTWFDSLEENR